MKTIIAGSRSFINFNIMNRHLESLKPNISEVVSGGARGADDLGELWGLRNKIPCKVFYADWSLGNSAGIQRNRLMGDYADSLIAFWDGTSPGTKHMIDYMTSLNKPVNVVKI